MNKRGEITTSAHNRATTANSTAIILCSFFLFISTIAFQQRFFVLLMIVIKSMGNVEKSLSIIMVQISPFLWLKAIAIYQKVGLFYEILFSLLSEPCWIYGEIDYKSISTNSFCNSSINLGQYDDCASCRMLAPWESSISLTIIAI